PVLLGGPGGQVTSTPVSVNFATVNGTATSPGDYGAVTGTLNFAPGQTVKTVVVPIYDTGPKPTRDFTVRLSNPTTNSTIADGTGTIVIGARTASPVASPTISAPPDIVVGEGDGYVDLPVRLSAPGLNPVTVNYSTATGAASQGNSCGGGT